MRARANVEQFCVEPIRCHCELRRGKTPPYSPKTPKIKRRLKLFAVVKRLATPTRCRILFLQFANPGQYPPILHVLDIFAKADWEALVIGIDQEETKALTVPMVPNRKVSLVSSAPPGWRQKVQYLKFVTMAVFYNLYWQPDVIYVSDVFATPAGCLVAWLRRVRIIFHEHDFPAPPPGGVTIFRWLMSARHFVAQHSLLCVVPNHARAQAFRRECNLALNRVITVWNCPSIHDIREVARSNPVRSELTLYYHGSLNYYRVPFVLLDALQDLPSNVTLAIHGYEPHGSKGFIAEFLSCTRQKGLMNRVSFRGPVAYSNLLNISNPYSVGLSLMPMASDDHNMQNMAGASNKAFDYLSMGIPLLVSALPDWEEIFVTPGFAKSCDPRNKASLCNAIRWFLDNPTEHLRMGLEGKKKIYAEWNYETQFKPVMQLITAAQKKDNILDTSD
jgi:glycosyltransferase involved in cell wall biosynthesis